MAKWSLPTTNLIGPRKLGGRTSRRGFTFQDTYTCFQLTKLLDVTQGLIKVRPEGAQDVDLLYWDGHEEYIQLKNEPFEHYSLVSLRPILQSFAVDLLEAGRSTTLAFTLVARGGHIDTAVKRLRDRKPSVKDISEVATLLGQSIQGSAAPQCLVELNEQERCSLVEQLLKQTTFRFGMGDEVDGRISFESHACTELARHGIASPDLQDAFNILRAALDSRREFTRADVEEVLKRLIGGAAIDLFEGRVQVLTDELLSLPANSQRVQQFYAGAPLGWDVIAVHGDIERDQQDDLVRLLSKPSETLKLVCVVAEPGAGKSTLAWRVAAELHRKHGAFVVRIIDKEDADIWYRMVDFYQKMKRPFYVLVDDFFRDHDVVNALRELSLHLPITVIATSRANEYRPHRLKDEVVRVSLKEPSPGEKGRILQQMGKTRADLTLEQQKRLDAANQFLVLMMEVTAGKELREIIRDTLYRLQVLDENVYRAYEYLCFAYKHSISMPSSLLARLDARGQFHKLPYRESAQGLIFYDEGHTENVRVGHPVIAETASTFYEALRAPAIVLQEIVTAADMSNYPERRFVAHLLRAVARAEAPIVHSAFPQIESAIEQCKQRATRISELTIWRAFHRNLGQHEKANCCVDAALMLVPVSAFDCSLVQNLCQERGWEDHALPRLAEWLEQHHEDTRVRTAYLGLVKRQGTPVQMKLVLKETSAWLGQHPEDTSVRTTYLGLVERQGSPKQVEQVLKETSVWLGQHPEDTSVRTAYLGLVERQGSPKHVEQVLKETSVWLEQHPEDTSVRTAYLGLVERHGTPERVEQVLKETKAWLAKHLEDTYVRTAYLGLVERQGSPKQVEQALKETKAWLAKHLEDTSVRTAYLGLVEREGSPKQVEQALKETKAWLAKHLEDTSVWSRLIALLVRLQRVDEAVKLAEKAISIHSRNVTLVVYYLKLIQDQLDEQRTRAFYIMLMEDHPHDLAIKNSFGRWLHIRGYLDEAKETLKALVEREPRYFDAKYSYGRLLLDMELYAEAADQFRQTLRIHKGHQMAHLGLAQALCGQASSANQRVSDEDANRCFVEVELEFHQAIYWAGKQGQPQAIFFTHLGRFYNDRGRFAEALEAFESARDEDPTAFDNYWGLGRALMGLGQFRAAANALRIALEKAPVDFGPPASEEIPELLRQCKAALELNHPARNSA